MKKQRKNNYATASLALAMILGLTGCAQAPFSSPELEESEVDEEEEAKKESEDQEEKDKDDSDKEETTKDSDKDKEESDKDKEESDKEKSGKSKKDDDNDKKGSSLSKNPDDDEDEDEDEDDSDDDDLIAEEDDDFDYDEWMDHATTHEEGDFFQKMLYGERYIDGTYSDVTYDEAVEVLNDSYDMTYHYNDYNEYISDMPVYISGYNNTKFGFSNEYLEEERVRIYKDYDEDEASEYYSNLMHLSQLDTVYLGFAKEDNSKNSTTSVMKSYLYKFDGDEVTFAGYSYDYSTYEMELDDENDWITYNIDLIDGGIGLSNDDFDITYKTSNRLRCESGLSDTAYCFGYAVDMDAEYDHINNLSFDYTSFDDGKFVSGSTSVYFGNDTSTYDSSAKITTDGDEITISLTQSYKNGKMVKDEHEIKGKFLDCGTTRLLLLIDGVWYDYTGDITDFYAVYDNVDTTGSLSEDQIASINEKRSGVIDELEKALGDLNCTIDETTGTIMLDNSVLFEFDSYELSSEGKDMLDEFMAVYIPVILDQIDEGNITSLEVSGFTDSTGASAYNQTLSEKRAATVAEYVISQYPDLEDYIMSAGYGENYLIYNSDGTENADASRRVEFSFNIAVD